ncbi:MAG: TldD/PmbA family protein [Candidatus Tyrphobacter sp.]
MDSAQRERLAREILQRSRADETEVLVASSDSALTRFTHEASNQNVASDATEVSVRAIVGGRTGVASASAFDAPGLETLARQATTMARLAPADPHQPRLPAGKPSVAPAGSFFPATASASPEVRARMCDALFSAAESGGCWSAGFVSTSSFGITVANTSGALSSFDGTDGGINVKMIAGSSSGWAEMHCSDVGEIDASAVASRAVRKANDGAEPQSVEPGAWTVILEPAAFGEMLAYLMGHFSAQRYDEGSSFCSDGLDRTYLGENVTIEDDYANPLAPSMPFDFEGYPTQRVTLVDCGVVKNVVTDSYYASKLGRANTGHALPAPNAAGPQPLHVVVAPGDVSVEELVAQTQRGLLVTRFWYIRTVDEKHAIITGMTRDGTFLVENGRVTRGVRNLRFNVSILEALRRCTFSRQRLRTSSYGYGIVVPAARIERFTFTSVTEF